MTTETRTAAQQLAALEVARKQFLAAVDGIPDGEMTRPLSDGWSVKDILSHIASWDELGATDLERTTRGHVPVLASFKDEEIDDWNAALMRGRTMFTLPQARFELEDRRNRLVGVLNACPEELAVGPLVGRLCEVLIEHDEQHAGEINDWRKTAGL